MAFLTGLLSSALPFIAKGVGGALSGALGAVSRGEGIGGALKGAALGGLGGLVGQPEPQPMIEPKPVYNVQPQLSESIPAFVQQRPMRDRQGGSLPLATSEMRMRLPSAPSIKIPSKFISKLKQKQKSKRR